MKKITFFFVSILFMSLSLYAQTPEKFNYQGIARNDSGEPMDNQNLGLQISILNGNSTVYTETHYVTTNAFGLYTLSIGEGTPVSGTMSSVDWSTGNKFIKVGIDPNGGSNYSDLGTTELLSVPYAMYAASSGGNSGGSNPTGAAGGDLTGTYPNPTIGNYKVGTPKLANNAVETAKISNGAVTALKLNDMGAANGQVLKYNGSEWEPGNDNQGSSGTNYTAGDGIGISGTNEITSDLGIDIETTEIQDGAVTSPKIDAMGATDGQFLKFDGTNWAPANLTGGGTGDDWGAQTAETADRLIGDGTSGSPLDLAQQGANDGQVLKWNNTNNTWEPADDEAGTGGGSGDDWGAQTVEADATLEGEGTTANPLTVADGAITSEKINDMGATNGQVLQFNGTIWEPANMSGGGTGDNWGSQIAETDGTFDGDGTTTAPLGLADAAVTGEKIDQMSAADGQVLKWNGTTWEPADDETATSGSGDDWGAQIAETDATLDGDGTTANPLAVADGAITSEKINDMSATSGQVLKFDGTNWVPGTDDGGTAGTTYTAGNGIDISAGNEITADLGTDIETSELQDAAVTTAKISDAAVNGEKIDQMSATNGQVLKWNGTTWEPADDELGTGGGSGDDWGTQVTETDITLDGDGTTGNLLGLADNGVTANKLATGAVTSEKLNQMGATNDQVLTWNGTNWLPEDATAGTGDDWGAQVTETDATLSGDGTSGNELSLAQQSATDGQVLQWDDAGSTWVPADGGAGTDGWALDGNAAGNDDFIGTTNDEALRFKFNDEPAGFINDENTAFGTESLSNTTGGGNTAMGSSSMLSNTTGAYNTAMGTGSLYNNIDGNRNTAIGNGALLFNTAGNNNTAIGITSLSANTTGNDNTATGYRALYANSTGDFNTATGFQALKANNTGYDNSAFGYESLLSNTIGKRNSAFGRESLQTNTEGNYNSAFGYQALQLNTTGIANSAFGTDAMNNNETGNDNSAFGRRALEFNIDGSDLAAFGKDALKDNVSGLKNTAMGSNALKSNTTADNNTATGFEALATNTTGNINSALGSSALKNNTEGFHNTAMGGSALANNTNGNRNTATGFRALDLNTSGSGNTAFGYRADVGSGNLINATAIGNKALVEQDNSLVLGSIAGVHSAAADTKVGIGTTTPEERLHVVGNELLEGQLTINEGGTDYSKIYFKNDNNNARWTLAGFPQTDEASSLFNFYYNDGTTGRDVLQISGQGRVGINHTPNGTPFYEGTLSIKKLDLEMNLQLISKDGSGKWGFVINDPTDDGNGNMNLYYNHSQMGYFSSTNGAYSTISDRRLKENITPTQSVLGKVEAIKIMDYNFKADKTQRPQIGYIAQELEKQFPEFVNKPNKNGERESYYTVNYAGMSAVAIKALQEQQEIIDAQNEKIEKMEDQLSSLEARLSALEN